MENGNMYRKSLYNILRAAVVAVLLAPGTAAGVYSGGVGIEPNPYRIGTVADWSTLAYTPEDWNKYFILINDIDFGGADVTPVGSHDQPFTGGFDGDGHVVRNGRIHWPDNSYIGLFCAVGEGGTISDLGIEELEVTGVSHVGGLVGLNDGGDIVSCSFTGTVSGSSTYMGGLVGENQDGTVRSCHAAGTVTGNPSAFPINAVGGLAGGNTGDISFCDAEAVFSGGISYVGGLVGESFTGSITHCQASGTFSDGIAVVGGLVGSSAYSDIVSCSITSPVVGTMLVGGLVGEDLGSAISLCYVTGAVLGSDRWVGGLIGSTGESVITSCYTTGPVTGASQVGGLVGNVENGTMTSCYAAGAVTGTYYVGGLVGYCSDNETIASCYATGTVTGTDYSIGGLVGGLDHSTVSNCYAAGTVTGDDYDVGGLVGRANGGVVSYCHAGGAVSGDYYVGGLVGYGDLEAEIASCYARGAVDGGTNIGGLVGHLHNGRVTSCYATGAVSGTASTGGLVGTGYGTVSSSYWNRTTTGQETSEGGEGRTTKGMTYPYGVNTYVGWAFDTVWTADESYLMNDGYPYLLETPPAPPHPADLDTNFRVAMSEAIAYLAGWQQGDNPMAYAIRAAYLWQNGEAYINDRVNDPPLCWLLAP